MKLKFSFVFLTLLALTSHAANYRICGKISTPATQYFGPSTRAHQSAVIDISDKLTDAKSIVAIRVNLRTGERTSDCKLIAKTSKNASDILWEEAFTPHDGWNYIRLQQPCSLKRISSCFVGYELTTTGAAIGGWSEDDPDIQVVLSGDFNDTETTKTEYLEGVMSRVVSTAVPYTYTATKVNSGNTIVEDLWPLEFKSESHDLDFSQTGQQNVEVCGFSYTVTAYDFAAPKMPLVELFTSQFCANCPAGEATMELALTHSGAQVAHLYHHAGYAPDAFTITESETLATELGVNSAPSMCIDRGTVFHPGNATETQFRELVRDWALAEIQIEPTWNDTVLNVNATFRRDTRLPGNVTLETWITQSGIKTYQSGNGTQYQEFEHNYFPLMKLSTQSIGNATKNTVSWSQGMEETENLKVVCYALINGKIVCARECDVPEAPTGIKNVKMSNNVNEFSVTPFVKIVNGRKILIK